LDLYDNASFDRAVMGTSVNSAFIVKADEDDTLRLAFGRGLKLPTLTNFAQPIRYLPQYSSLFLSENPNLLPMPVYDWRISWDRQVDGPDTKVRLALFHDMTMKYIGAVSVPLKSQVALLTATVPGSVSNGTELGITHRARTGWTWSANYTFDRLHEHLDLGLRDSLPEHKINASIGYAWEDWDADLYATYNSATKGLVLNAGRPAITAIGNVKEFTVLSPHIGWRASENIRLEASAENLWPYQDSLLQRMETSYFLTMTISF
jgi:outer membrane receptor protein involved in Fe transport